MSARILASTSNLLACCFGLFVAQCALSPPASSQPSEQPDIEVIVVTATRQPTPKQQLASSVSVITSEEIERRQLRLVTDALRYVPGIDVRRNGGPGTNTSIFIRGADSDHVLVLLDGVELNDPSSPSRLPLLNHLTTEDIDRIEVVRGPQSGLYGGDAIGGVIQIFTKRGQKGLSVSASAEGGSYATGRGTLALSGGSDSVRYALSVSHWDSDGFSARSAGSEKDGYRNTTASGRLSWEASQNAGLDASLRFTDAHVEFDGSVEADHFTDSQQLLARVAPRLRLFEGAWEQTLAAQFTRNERDTTSTFPSRVEGDLYGIDWKSTLRVVDAHVLTIGIENEWEEARFSAFDDSRHTLSFYAQDQLTWGERFFGSVAVRVDAPSDFESRVTYRVTGGVSLPKIRSTLRGSYGTGFKAPSLSQLNPTAFGGNPDLNPEEARGFDLGLETSLRDGQIVSTATFFYSDIDELIVAVFDPGTSRFLNFNIDRSKAYGVETTLSIAPIEELRLVANYTYTHTEAQGAPAGFGIEDGSRLLRRPDHKASLDFIGRFLGERGEASATVRYVGSRRDLDPVTFSAVTAPSYVTLDLNARFAVTDWLTVYGRIENVLDEDYEDVLGFQTAGVSAYAGIRLHF